RLAVRDGKRLEHQASRLSDRLELEEQARFADPGLADGGDHLSPPALRVFERALHLRQFGLASHELGEPAPRRRLQPRTQLAEPRHVVHVDRLADAFNPGCAERRQDEVAFAKAAGRLAHHDRPGPRDALQPRCEIGRVTDWGVLDLALAGLNRADHYFAGVY